jgi:hypothetical protein
MAIAQIEEMGGHEVERIRNEGKKEIEAFRSDLLQRKKEYLKSQIQTALGVLEKAIRMPMTRSRSRTFTKPGCKIRSIPYTAWLPISKKKPV